MTLSAALPGSRQARLLRELGLVRYRLRAAGGTERSLERAGVSASESAVDRPGIGDSVPQPRPRLRVCAGMAAGQTPEGAAGEIWAQILAWLRLDSSCVEWCERPAPDVVPLPPPVDWLQPQGKRELWQILKPQMRNR